MMWSGWKELILGGWLLILVVMLMFRSEHAKCHIVCEDDKDQSRNYEDLYSISLV
jgi:hypothetical protein